MNPPVEVSGYGLDYQPCSCLGQLHCMLQQLAIGVSIVDDDMITMMLMSMLTQVTSVCGDEESFQGCHPGNSLIAVDHMCEHQPYLTVTAQPSSMFHYSERVTRRTSLGIFLITTHYSNPDQHMHGYQIIIIIS